MSTIQKTLTLFALLILSSVPAVGRERIQGWCEQGNRVITVNTTTSSTLTPVQRSFPSCTVTVYATGTATVSTIYADNSGTAKANPFTAATSGYWFFYADNGVYDVQFSGGGISPTFTFGAMSAFDPRDIIPSVLDYGAKCDGATDDTVAIQAGITATASALRWLLLPGGTCLFSALTVPSNTHILGQGSGASTLKQKNSGAVAGVPLIKNQGSSNSNITFEGFTLDGNQTNQSVVASMTFSQDVDGIYLNNVTTVRIVGMQFINILAKPIFGSGWADLAVRDSTFSNYNYNTANGNNAAAIELSYDYAVTLASRDIQIVDNFIDGTAGNTGGIKLAGTSSLPITDINIQGNNVTIGNCLSQGCLGIEIYNNGPTASIGYGQFRVVNNLIVGQSSASPQTAPTWGISVAGAGGHDGVISSNVVRWMGAYGIELSASINVAISDNSVSDGAGIYVLATAPSLAAGAVNLKNVSVVNNVVSNPQRFTQASAAVTAIQLYGETTNTATNVNISGNTLLLPDATYVVHGILIQCNGGSGSFSNIRISENLIKGAGSGSLAKGVIVEVDAPCPISGVTITGNRFDTLLQAIAATDQTTTLVGINSYGTIGSRFGAGLSATTPYFELVPGASPSVLTNTFRWDSYTPTIGTVMGSSVVASDVDATYFQVGKVVFIRIFATINISTATASSVTFTVPVLQAGGTNQTLPTMVYNNSAGTVRTAGSAFSDASVLSVYSDAGKFPTGTDMNFRITGVYEANSFVAP